MANSTGWEDVSGNTGKKGGDKKFKEYPRLNYARVEYDEPYDFRPLENPRGFLLYMRQHEDGSWRRAICGDVETCPVATKHNLEPNQKYAIVAINRANQQAELLEFTPGVYNRFKEIKELTKKSPGGSQDGSDFRLLKTKKVMKDGKTRTSYTLERIDYTPLTAEEKEKIVGPLLDFFKDDRLGFIYKATPTDKIEEILFGKRDKAPTNSSGSSYATSSGKNKVSEGSKTSEPEATDGDNIPF